jgi:hypothetical protein
MLVQHWFYNQGQAVACLTTKRNQNIAGAKHRINVRPLLQAVIWRVWRDRTGHMAVNFTLPNILEGPLHDLAAAITGVIHVGQKINRPDGSVSEQKNRVDELIIMESRRGVTVIHQFTVLEGAAVKRVVAQIDALVFEGLILINHVLIPQD